MSEQSLNPEQLELLSEFRSRREVGIMSRKSNPGQYKRLKPFNPIGSKRTIVHLDPSAQFALDYSGLRGISGNTYGCTDCGYPCRCRPGTGFDMKYSTETFRTKSPNYPQTLVLS